MLLKSITNFSLLTAAVCAFGYVAVNRYHAVIQRGAPPVIAIDSRTVIGDNPDFLGNPHASLTLVEFGDYECPPCRRMNGELHQYIINHSSALRLTFRNYPLDKIHPHAHRAARCAEAARIEGHFWQTHDYLYSGDRLSDDMITKAAIKDYPANNQNERLITDKIAADVAAANSAGVDGTPSFFLCNGSSHVYRLSTWKQVERFLSVSRPS